MKKRVKVDPEGCWEWQAAKSGGYGHVWIYGKQLLAHRVAYILFNGPIKDGLQIDHLCRNRSCINPAHLEVVTIQENLLRGKTIAARQAAQKHCKYGHEFTPENTYTWKNTRHCRQCQSRRNKEYWARKKAMRPNEE